MRLRPNDPRLRAGLALFEAIAAVTATMLLVVALTFAIAPREAMAIASLGGQRIPDGLFSGPLPPVRQALAWTLGIQGAVLAAAALGLLAWRCPRITSTRSWGGRIAWGLGAGLVAFGLSGVIAVLQELAGIPVEEQEPLLRALREVPLAAALPWIAVAAPVGEELFFRGYLFRFLHARGPSWLAYAASTAAFAVIHFNVTGLLVYAAIGLVLAIATRRTGSLLVPILGHAVHNGLTLLAVYGDSHL